MRGRLFKGFPKLRKVLFRLSLYCGAAVFLFLILFPIYWIFVSSLQPLPILMRAEARLWPHEATLEHYIILFEAQYGVKLFRLYIQNSLKVAISVALISTLIASTAAYGLSRYRFHGKEVLGRLMLFIYVFPTVVLITPIYRSLAKVGLIDTHIGLIILHTALTAPFATWLLWAFFDAIPKELEEAAAVDGASRGQSFFHVVLPLASPGILTAAIYSLVISWGEYMFAAILISSEDKKTVPLGLATYMTEQYIEWGQLLAGTVLAAIPIILIFMLLSRYFLKGFLEGALK